MGEGEGNTNTGGQDVSEFWEQYRRPEWQKRRLEVMEKAKFACQDCGSAEKTLNVHHAFYSKGRKPWEYPDTALRCLCENCHELRHNWMEVVRHMMGNLHPDFVVQVQGYIEAILLSQGVIKHIQLGQEYRSARGVADALSLISPDAPLLLMRAEDENGRLTSDGIDQVQLEEDKFRERLAIGIVADLQQQEA